MIQQGSPKIMRKLSVLIAALLFLFTGVFTPAYPAQLFNYPKFSALAVTGQPMAGGKLYTYEQGTTTPKAAYKDRAMITAHANPIVLDSNGEETIYLNGFYKVVLKNSAGVTKWTMDKVEGINSFYFPAYEVDAVTTYGSGTSYTSTTISTALTAIGTVNRTVLVLRPGSWTLLSNLTIPPNIVLKIAPGATITQTAAFTLTINGPFHAGLYQVFSGFAAGDIIFGPGSVKEIWGEWFGASGGATGAVNSTALQNALDSVVASASKPVLRLASPSYTITTGLTALTVTGTDDYLSGLTILGTVGQRWENDATPAASGTRLYYTGAGTALKIGDAATTVYALNVTLKDFSIAGTATGAAGLNVNIIGSNVDNVTVSGFTGASASGILYSGWQNKINWAAVGNKTGVTIGQTGSDTTVSSWYSCSANHNTGKGIVDVSGQGVTFYDLELQGNGDSGYYVDASAAATAGYAKFYGGSVEGNNATVAGYQMNFTGFDSTFRYTSGLLSGVYFGTGGASASGHIYGKNTDQLRIDHPIVGSSVIPLFTNGLINTALMSDCDQVIAGQGAPGIVSRGYNDGSTNRAVIGFNDADVTLDTNRYFLSGITKLGSVVANLSDTGKAKTTIFTVPDGKFAMITHVIVRTSAADLAGGTDFDIGSGAACTSWRGTINLSSIDNNTRYMVIPAVSAVPEVRTIEVGGATFGILPITGATASPANATVEAYGIIY
jgi:hypothetical protein